MKASLVSPNLSPPSFKENYLPDNVSISSFGNILLVGLLLLLLLLQLLDGFLLFVFSEYLIGQKIKTKMTETTLYPVFSNFNMYQVT